MILPGADSGSAATVLCRAGRRDALVGLRWRLQTVLRSLISRFPLGWSPYSEVVEWLRFLPEVITSWAMPLPPPPLPPPSALTRSPCRDAWLWFGLMEGTSATARKQCRINSYSLD